MDKILQYARMPRVWGFFVSVAVLAIISLAFFYPDNFEGNSLNQADMMQGAANGQEGAAFEALTGEKALWTNSLFSGMPTFQISPSYPSNSLFAWIDSVMGLWLPAPSNLLFMMMFGFLIMMCCMKQRWWVGLIGAVAWGFSSYYIIIIGAGHIWKFVTLAYVPPTIGALVLCYRGRYMLGAALTGLFAMMQLNANHPQMSYYFAFVMAGLSIAYLVEAARKKRLRQWSLGTCALLAGGLLAIGANSPSIFTTWQYAKETKRAQSELTPLPSADDAGAAVAERPTGGMPKADIVNWSYGQAETFSLLIPNIKGGASAKPVGGQMAATQMSALPDAQSTATYDAYMLLPYFQQYFNEGEGTNGPVYVGAIICALFLVGCVLVKGPVKWALVALTLISIVLAWGRNCEGITDFMIYHFPMYNKFRAVESILVIAEFTMPLLAMLALGRLVDIGAKADADKREGLKALYAGFGVPALICLVAWFAPGAFQHNDNADLRQMAGQEVDYLTMRDAYTMSMIYEQLGDQTPVRETFAALTSLRRGMVKDDAMRSLLFLAIGFGLMWLYLRGKAREAVAGCGIGALVLIDLYGVDKRYLSHESFAPAMAQAQDSAHAPDAVDQAILRDKDLSFHVMDIPGFDLPDRSYHHKMIGGYHAAKLNRYEDLIRRRMAAVRQYGYLPELRDDSVAALYADDNRAVVSDLRADYRVLDMLNARYIITGSKDQPAVVNTSALGNAWLVGSVDYVAGADAEMDALASINPAVEAVADEKFRAVLGEPAAAPSADDYVRLTAYTPNTLTYETSTGADAVAVFSEIYFPWGWSATIDGEKAEIGRVDYVLRALRLPAGKHTVVMNFDPQSLRVTGGVAYACIILIYLLLAGSIGLAAVKSVKAED